MKLRWVLTAVVVAALSLTVVGSARERRDASMDEGIATVVDSQDPVVPGDPRRQTYQDFLERLEGDFIDLTGHRLKTPFYAALSDLERPRDYSAVAITTDNLEDIEDMFDDGEDWRMAETDVAALLATSPRVCVIVIGRVFMRREAREQLSGLMHELTHCHQHEVHPQGTFAEHPVWWMDEGYAVWAGEMRANGTPTGIRYWDAYFKGGIGGAPEDGFNIFTGDYSAHSFFAALARAGVNPWIEFRRFFGTVRSNEFEDTERYKLMIQDADAESLAGWTASATRNFAFGAPWTSENSPGAELSTGHRLPEVAHLIGSTSVTIPPGTQRYFAYDVETSAAEPSLITIAAKGLGTLRWQHDKWKEQFTLTDNLDLSWCVGEECTCDDGSSPAPGARLAPISSGEVPRLHAALLGNAVFGTELTVSVKPVEDVCPEVVEAGGAEAEVPEPEVVEAVVEETVVGETEVVETEEEETEEEEEEETEVVSRPLDRCLFGVWNPDADQFRELLLRSYRTISVLSGLTIEGTIDLTFHDDGTFFHTYNGVRGTGVADGRTYTGTWTGGTYGTWEASGGVMTLNFTGSNISVALAPVPIAQGPYNIPPSSVEANYVCGRSALQVEPPPMPFGLWPIPTDWTKIRDVAPLR